MASTPATIGDLIASTQRQIRRGVRQAHPGIPPHAQRALRTITQEPIRPARLAELLNITPRAVTSVLDSLAEADLVAVTDDPSDRRAKIATITTEGESALAKAERTRIEIMESLLADLEPAEVEELARLLGKLTHNGHETH